MSMIESIKAFEVLDSRGFPTVCCTIKLASGDIASAHAPSGASIGGREVNEVRDDDLNRYMGKGVLQVVDHIENTIAPVLIGQDVQDQQAIDQKLIDLNQSDLGPLGSNAILPVSLAVAQVCANYSGLPLYAHLGGQGPFMMPVPMMNVINGGVHADNNLDIQEFMIVPTGAACFSDAVRMGSEIYHALRTILHQAGLVTAVGDEGGFAPSLPSHDQALAYLMQACSSAGYAPGRDVFFALDVAASGLFHKGQYHLYSEKKSMSPSEWITYFENLVSTYPIVSIEDMMAEDDWLGWRYATERLGNDVQLVGDDLFVTQEQYLQQGIDKQVSNAILIKPNQVGTVTQTLSTVASAMKAEYSAVFSHRSGETQDIYIADLAVATSCGQIKTGAPCRMERVAKYNRIIAIENELGQSAQFPGLDVFKQHKKVQSINEFDEL